MLKIHDLLLARRWREKFYIVLAITIVVLLAAAAIDIFILGRVDTIILGVLCAGTFWMMLLELRYRMHKGTFGSRAYEFGDLNGWTKKNV